MPHMVHFSARICLSDCRVLKVFLEEFLRRAEIRTVLERSVPETDHAICGGFSECPEWYISGEEFALRVGTR